VTGQPIRLHAVTHLPDGSDPLPLNNVDNVYMPRIAVSVSGYSFPEHFNFVDFDTVAPGYDTAVYDFVTGDPDALRFVSPGIFMVVGLLVWNYDWDFADFQIEIGLGGTGSGQIFTGAGTRTQTGVREGIAGESNYKEQFSIFVVESADPTNWVSAEAGVRNESGAARTSGMTLSAMRMSTNVS
jgi:hypothetical protein